MADAASVHLLRPVRVLVAGGDRRFVARATDELSALGFDVMSTTTNARVAELTTLQRINVVLLDASGGVAAAAALAATLDALPQRVRVLLAGGRGRAAARLGYEFVQQSASAEELAAAVHRAYRGGPRQAERSRHG
jgi:DNA-binding NtrC family response regulator